MVTSFADGSKISFEQAIAANATGFKVQARGMSRGVPFDGSPLDLPSLYDIDEVRALGGIVDYTVGPSSVKVFCLAEHSDPKQRHYLSLYKLGDGPLYPFWIPYHLPTFEAPNAIARVVLLGDGLAPPLGGPVGRGLRGREARPEGRRDARRLRHVHDLRRGRERRRDERRALPARGPGRGLSPAAATSPATRCSATTTSSCRRAGSPTGCAPSSIATSAARPGSRNGCWSRPEPGSARARNVSICSSATARMRSRLSEVRHQSRIRSTHRSKDQDQRGVHPSPARAF